MSIFKAIILGLIQGFTEFIPISSSGHLTLMQKLFGIEEPTLTFDIILHIATLIPIFVVFWEDIWSLLKNPLQKMTGLLIAGTIPTVILALAAKNTIDSLYQTGGFLGINFILTGLVLLYADKKNSGRKKIRQASLIDSLFIGLFQSFAALFPGISRSGMTITGALIRDFDRDFAAKYSFLLSIPAILGSLVLTLRDVYKGETSLLSFGVLPTLFGFLAAMITGYIAIRFMLSVIRNSKLTYFSYYLFLLGALVCLDQFFLHIFF